jgi:aspartate/methionine/tyrosine aminotransferase
MRFSKRLKQFPEYIFSALNKKITVVEKKSGRKVLNFGVGSPNFPPSQLYIHKLKEYINEPDSHLYTGYGPIPELADALKTWYRQRFGVGLFNEELYSLLGAKDGVSHLSLALLDKSDEVLVPDPGYPGFSGPALMVGATPVYYNLIEANNFKINLNELEKQITPKTKLIWVNFPHNPTGQVVNLSELEPIVDFCFKHKIWLVYDNAYSEITFNGYQAPSILQIKKAKEIAVEIGSFSKTFSFAGFRIGYVVGNKDLIRALAKVKSQMDSGLSLVWQKLAAFALMNFDQDWYEKMIKNYKKRRDIIASYLKKLGLTFQYPKGGLYLWAKIPKNYKNSERFVEEILKKYQVLFTPGTAFGKNGKRYVRVSICSNIDKISQYLISNPVD